MSFRSSAQLDFGQFLKGFRSAWNSEHRVVLDNLVRAFEHELHGSHVSECRPSAFAVGPVEEFEAIGVGNRTQACNRIGGAPLSALLATTAGFDVELVK